MTDRSPEPSEVETVAVAIHTAEAEQAWLVGEGRIGAWDYASDDLKVLRRRQATAALDAARGRSCEDTEAGSEEAERGNIVHDEISAAWRRVDAYKAELDEALAVLGEIHRRTTPQGDAGNRVAYQLSGHALRAGAA